MKLIIIPFFLILAAFSCNSTRTEDRVIDKILTSSERLKTKMNLLQGKWYGHYEIFDPTYDTIFYNDYREKLEFDLTNSISDSSLIKEILILDTFKLRPLEVVFSSLDSVILTSKAQFRLSDSTFFYPVTMNLAENLLNDANKIQFGRSLPSIHDSTIVIHLQKFNQMFLNDVFTKESFILTIRQLTTDSLQLVLPYGLGKMIFIRDDR